MARIFSVLALLALVLLAANLLVGLWIGDFNTAAQEYREAFRRYETLRRNPQVDSAELAAAKQAVTQAEARAAGPRDRKAVHFYLGVATSLLAILVHSITVTYFVGTSRWCKEVVQTYRLPPSLADRSARLKRGTFPWAVGGMLVIVAVAALGGLADPSTPVSQRNPDWPAAFVTWHFIVALLGLAATAWSYGVQISRIAENYAVIEEILAAVHVMRVAKGLPTEA